MNEKGRWMGKRIFLFAVLAAILVLILILAKAKVEVIQREPPTTISPFLEALSVQEFKERKEAPPFTLSNLEGEEVSLKDYRGGIVFLNFWATWCPPCREEMPSMERLYKKFKEEDFIILAVDLRESLKQVKFFMRQYKLTFPALLDSTGRVGNAYQARTIPTTYLIDRQGRMVGRAVGARDWASKEAFALIEALLAEEESS